MCFFFSFAVIPSQDFVEVVGNLKCRLVSLNYFYVTDHPLVAQYFFALVLGHTTQLPVFSRSWFWTASPHCRPVSDPHPVSRRSSLPGTRALPVLSDTRPQEGTTLGGVRRWDPHFPSQRGSWRSPDWLEKKTECRSARLVRFWQITGVSRIFKSSQRYV